jgi:PAS domain S-box-containing protein
VDNYGTEVENIKKILRSRPKGMSVTDISKELGISRNTVAKYLEILLISGHVDMENIGTAKIYCLSQRVPTSTLLHFSSDLILVVDSNLSIIQANQKFLDSLGLSKGQIIGKRANYDLFPLASKTGIFQKLKEAVEGNEYAGKIHVEIKNVDHYFNCKIIPSIFDDGEQGATLIFDDITDSVNEHHRLMENHDHLEELVYERTKELEELNKSLKTEIAERKKIEELLQIEKNLAQNYLDIASVIIVILDNEGKCQIINKKGISLIGQNEKEVIGKNFLENFVPKREHKAVKDIFKDVSKGTVEHPETYELHIICQNEEKLIKWSNVSLKNEHAQTTGVIASGEDITEQRKNELLLKESEERYRNLFMDSPLANQLMTKEGLLLDVNPAWTEMTGYNSEEAIGRYMDNFLVPEDIGRFRNNLKLADTDNINHADYSMLTKTGECIITSYNCRYKNDQDEHKPAFHCIIKDVSENRKIQSELRENNERLENILESIQSGIVIVDASNYRITYANPATSMMLGEKKENIVGKRCDRVFCNLSSERCPFESSDENIHQFQCVLLKENGDSTPIVKKITRIEINGKLHYLENFIEV